MRKQIAFVSLSLGLGLAAPTPAQLSLVTTAPSGGTVRGTTSPPRCLAATSDGRLWTLSYLDDGKGQGGNSRFLRLHASSDAGKTWKLVTRVQNAGAIRGSIACGNDGRMLHCAWRATGATTTASSIYHQVFDTRKNTWVGSPTQIARGTTSNSQFLEPCIEITEDGRVYVAYYTHRQGPWAGRFRAFDGTAWGKEQKVNVDTYGVHPNCQADGNDVWFSYRTNSGGYGIRARRWDGATQAWGKEGELQVSQANSSKVGSASSVSNVCVDLRGDVHVLYATGDRAVGKGAVWVSTSRKGANKFARHVKVDDDAAMRGGNYNYHCYSMSLSVDGRLYFVYSKVSEQYAKLYTRFMLPNGSMGPRIQVASGLANSHTWVSAYRRSRDGTTPMAIVTDTGAGAVRYWGSTSAGLVVPHGQSCDGTNASAPRLRTGGLPQRGQTLTLLLSAMPKTTPLIVFLGLSDTRLGAFTLPLPLDALGLKGCALAQSFFVNVGGASDGSGNAQMQIPYPNDPRLPGVPLYFQFFVVAPGANAAGALMSNGIATISR